MKFFTEHPRSVGETYFEHMGVAFSFGGTMVIGGLACLAHGVFPRLFMRTASRTVQGLYQRMVAKRFAKQLPPDCLDFVI